MKKYFVPKGIECRLLLLKKDVHGILYEEHCNVITSNRNCYFDVVDLCEGVKSYDPGWICFKLPPNKAEWTHAEFHCEHVKAIEV